MNPARWGGKPDLGESVSALRFRPVDGAELSRHPVREVRGRRHLPLPQRGRGTSTMERPGGSLRSLQAGSASAEDEARLLQGYEPTWRLSGPLIRLSRILLSAEKGEVARQSIRCFILARGQSESAEGHPADDPTMGVPSSARQDAD